MGEFQYFIINARIYPIYIQWWFNIDPTFHVTVITFCIILVWVDLHREQQKTT